MSRPLSFNSGDFFYPIGAKKMSAPANGAAAQDTTEPKRPQSDVMMNPQAANQYDSILSFLKNNPPPMAGAKSMNGPTTAQTPPVAGAKTPNGAVASDADIYRNPYEGLDYYIDPATGEPIIDSAATGIPEVAATPEAGNEDPTKIGHSADTIIIPTKVSVDEDDENAEELEEQQEEALQLLTKSTDKLDMGGGSDVLNIQANKRRGTIKLADGGEQDKLYLQGENHNLTINTDAQDAIILEGPGDEWNLRKVGSKRIYHNSSTQNTITVTGDAKVACDDGSEIKDPDAKMSNENKISDEVKKVDNMSSEQMAKEIVFEKLSESEKDYVALQFVLRMDNAFSGADQDSGFFGIGADDLTDEAFGKDDWNRCVGAATTLNPKLADRIKTIYDNYYELTKLDHDNGGDWWFGDPYFSRKELENLRVACEKGETIKSLTTRAKNIKL